jgi:hypothetical protein
VRAEIVENDDVARPQSWDEDLVDVEAEGLAVDRAVDQPRCGEAIMAQGSEEGHCRPAAVRHLGGQALTARSPAPERGHVGLGAGLVDEDQASGIDAALIGAPLLPSAGYVRPVAFAGDERLFLKLSPSS